MQECLTESSATSECTLQKHLAAKCDFIEVFFFLLFYFSFRQNSILADEMGLGKTIQSISFLIEVQVSIL